MTERPAVRRTLVFTDGPCIIRESLIHNKPYVKDKDLLDPTFVESKWVASQNHHLSTRQPKIKLLTVSTDYGFVS